MNEAASRLGVDPKTAAQTSDLSGRIGFNYRLRLVVCCDTTTPSPHADKIRPVYKNALQALRRGCVLMRRRLIRLFRSLQEELPGTYPRRVGALPRELRISGNNSALAPKMSRAQPNASVEVEKFSMSAKAATGAITPRIPVVNV